jgi:hypothetical protein
MIDMYTRKLVFHVKFHDFFNSGLEDNIMLEINSSDNTNNTNWADPRQQRELEKFIV